MKLKDTQYGDLTKKNHKCVIALYNIKLSSLERCPKIKKEQDYRLFF